MDGGILRNKKGVALVIALIILLILTLIGISAINTTTFETALTGNERAGTAAFYASEAILDVALDRLPDVTQIPRTEIGKDSYGRTGRLDDKNSTGFTSFGSYSKEGYDASWTFNRYQINAIGESFGAMKEVETQVTYGPFPAGTQY